VEDTKTSTFHRDSEFLYRSVPQVNNFIYPPLRPSGPNDSTALAQKIELDHCGPEGAPFTIFVSIPYCEVRCHSCHMFKGLLPSGQDRTSLLDEYLECLFQQIEAYAATTRFSSAKCGAIYLGGGTASLLSAGQVKRLIGKLRESFASEPEMEITFEGNPNDFSLNYLEEVKPNGITRLSIGYQSGNDLTLKSLNSPHRASEGLAAVRNALAVQFKTVNVDLLFNIPGQTLEQWQQDLYALIEMGPQGISPGDYVVFSGTPAESLMSSGRLGKQQDLGTVDLWYQWTRQELAEHGYNEQVRNIFAKRDHPYKYVALCCNENREILGLGAGAYSFIGRHQFEAAGDAETYKAAIRRGQVFQAVTLSPRASDKNLMERYVMHNFFASVLSRPRFKERFGADPLAVFPEVFSKLENNGLVSINDEEIRFTPLGQKWRRNIYYDFRAPEFKTQNDSIVCISAARPRPGGAAALPSRQ
jgi:oxygen-independent coproporphyrinogen-3 oxidase